MLGSAFECPNRHQSKQQVSESVRKDTWSYQYPDTSNLIVSQEYTTSWRQVAVRTKFCTVAPNISGYSVWSLVYVTFLAPWILSLFLDFWKNVFILNVSHTDHTNALHNNCRTAPPGARVVWSIHGCPNSAKAVFSHCVKNVKLMV